MSQHSKIFVGCRALGLDNDARKAMQLQLVGKESLTDMTEEERQTIVAHLTEKGAFKKPFKAADRADIRLIHVMWKTLSQHGKTRVAGRAGLNKFIRAQFGDAWGAVPADVDMLTDTKQINTVLKALRDWIDREGIEFHR